MNTLTIKYTVFPSTSAASKQGKTSTWDDFAEIFRQPSIWAKKTSCPLLSLGVYGDVKSEKGALRYKENLKEVHGVEGDIDAGLIGIDEVVSLLDLAGLEAVVFTTASHTEASPRLRVLCPLSKPVKKEMRAHYVSLLNDVLQGHLAHESWTPSQSYYFGRVEGVPYRYDRTKGQPIDLAIGLEPRAPQPGAKAGAVVNQPIGEGEDGMDFAKGLPESLDEIVASFNEEHGHDFAPLLEIHGYDARGSGRWIFPESTTGVPGVFLMKDRKHITSNHGLDPLHVLCDDGSPKPLDYFDCWRILEHGGSWGTAIAAAKVELGFTSTDQVEDVEDQEADTGPAKSSKRRTLKAYRFDELQARPKASWLIRGVLPRHGLGCLYGPSGAGKSFAALDLGLCIARGIPWQGNYVEQASVIHVAAEGGHGFGQRLKAYQAHHAAPLAGVPFHVCPDGLDLTGAPDVHAVIDMAKTVTTESGRVGLIVIDTLNRVLAGADENSSVDMGKVVRAMTLIAEMADCLVLCIHHSGKDSSKGARGHSSLRAAMDVELSVQSEASGGKSIKVTKQRDGADGLTWGFKLEPVEIGVTSDFEPVIVPVVVPAGADTARKAKTGRPGTWAPLIEQAVGSLGEDQVSVTSFVETVRATYQTVHGKAAPKNAVTVIMKAIEDAQAKGLLHLDDDFITCPDPLLAS